MDQLLVVRLGLVPYEEGVRGCSGRSSAARAGRRGRRRRADARAPARLHQGPPLDRRRAADGRGLVSDAGDRGRRRPTAAGRSPTTAPGSWSPIRSSTCARSRPDDVHEFVRLMERAMIAALGDYGVEARLIDGLTGVWVGDEPPPAGDARKIGSIGIHVQPRDHHARARRQRRQRPAAVRVGGPVRDRGLPDDLADPRARQPSRTSTSSPTALVRAARRGLRARAGRGRGGRRPRVTNVGDGMSETAERIHVTRSRANPGGATGIEGRPFRERKPPWLKVPGARRRRPTAS